MSDNNVKIGSAQQYSPLENYELLTDGFSRRLTYLRLSITDFCNFSCEYCLPNGYQGKRPDDE